MSQSAVQETDRGGAIRAEGDIGLKRVDLVVLLLYGALCLCWFAPILLAGRLLAPGDGTTEYVPNYLTSRTLWEPALGTGYPAAADPLTFTWYPPAILLSSMPGSYNIFVISAYVFAGWFTYLLVFTLTASRLAGWISGILFGLSGFLMAHAGHPSIIHSAAWIPAVILGVERLRTERGPGWFAFGCFATGCLVLSGHPQIVLYGLLFALAFAGARGLAAGAGRWPYLRRLALMFALGVALGAVLVVPLLEFSRLTIRQHVSFDFFNFGRFPLRYIALLFFPNLLGGEDGSIYGERFFADTEQDAYLGFLTLALAVFAFVWNRRAAAFRFFLLAGAVSLLFSFGGDTPVGKSLYLIPPFNQFRCQGRFLVIFQLSFAVLAGFGAKALFRDGTRKKAAAATAVCLLILHFGAALAVSLWQGPQLRDLALSRGVPDASFALTEPLFLAPIACAVAAAIAIAFAAKYRAGRVSAVLLTAAAVADMGAFGLFSSWRYHSPGSGELDPPSTVEVVRPSAQRVVAVRGALGKMPELPPNTSKLWKVDSLNRYGSLAVARYHSLAGMDPGGTIAGPWWRPRNRALDILAARYFTLPDADIGEMDRFQDIPIPSEDLGEDLDAGRMQAAIALDRRKRFTSLALISVLHESLPAGQGRAAAELRLRAQTGHDIVIPVIEGRDTAASAPGCGATTTPVERRPAIFRNAGGACLYFAQWPLNAEDHYSTLEMNWLSSQGGMNIAKLVLWNNRSGEIQALNPVDFYPDRFRLAARRRRTRVYENRRALPRTWLVSRLIRLSPAAMEQAIQTSSLPGGAIFDPSAVALVEDGASLPALAPDPSASAVLTRAEKTLVEVKTHSRQAAFLVLADLYYPGWTATVNSVPVTIHQTNFVQRGVEAPAGDNVVRFVFRPWSVYIGLGVTLASLAGIAVATWRSTPRRLG